MYELVGKPVFKDDIMQKGVIIRHLILPWHYKESMQIVKYIWEKYHDNVYLSLMNQYTPMYKALSHPKLKRKLTTFEYNKVVDFASDLVLQIATFNKEKPPLKILYPILMAKMSYKNKNQNKHDVYSGFLLFNFNCVKYAVFF